jgi:predicted transcriptional regulator
LFSGSITDNTGERMKKTSWPEELVTQYGGLPIWSVTWHEYYVQHCRHQQTFIEAQRLALEHHGQISLVVPEARDTSRE